MGFRRLVTAAFALVAIAPAWVAGSARATQTLPIIVTYELERQRDAARVERRDPQAFWIREIVARLEDKKPTNTLGLKQPATAQVNFTVARDGTIVSKSIARTSGIPAVDEAALRMLERAQPFPPMPAAMTLAALPFSVPLRFR